MSSKQNHLFQMSDEELYQYFKKKRDAKLAIKKAKQKAKAKIRQKWQREKSLLKDLKRARRMDQKDYRPSTMSNNVVAGVLTKKSEERIKKIIDWIGEGLSRFKIQENIMTEFKLSKLSARNYIQASYRYLKEMSDEDREFMREKHHAMLSKLYEENKERGDLREAHQLVITINKMFGVNEPEKNESKNIFEFKFNTAPTPIVITPSEEVQAQNVDYFALDKTKTPEVDDEEDIDEEDGE